MKSKIEQLMKKYREQTERDKSETHAYMGSLGVSPKHLKLYEKSLDKLKREI